MNSAEEAIKLEVRLSAIEYLLSKAYLALTLTTVPLDRMDKHFEEFIAGARSQPFPSSDSGVSALASGEWEEAITRLVDLQRALLAQSLRRAGS